MRRAPRLPSAPALPALALAALFACGGPEAPGERPAREPDPASRRALSSGEAVGFTGRYGSHVWLGLPYAAPPTGPRRWRAPEPPGPWEGTREATRPARPCPQLANPLGGVTWAERGTPVGAEDCLVANVYAPRLEPGALPGPGERLPVMVWIHGGGNVIGHAGFYDVGRLAAERDVVVVAVQYRLGPLGWLRHPALRKAGGATPAERSGNFATLDLVRALEWVRENAAAFGGDPERVTIFGESAGGTNVFTLLLAPQAEGLFHRAVAQSGGTETSDPHAAEALVDDGGDPLSSGELLLALLQRDGSAADRAEARRVVAGMDAASVAGYLRGKDPYELLRVQAERAPEGEGLLRMPKVFAEGSVLPEADPLEVLGTPGAYNAVPTILGTNRDESKLFMFGDPRHVRRLLWILPRRRDPERYEAVAHHLSRMWKATGADEPAAAMRRAQGPSVWVYRFDWDEEPTVLGADLSELIGAGHGLEIPFVFGHFELGPAGDRLFTEANAPGRRALSEKMGSYWTELADRGRPGRGRSGRLPRWPAWEPEAPEFLVLDTEADGGLRRSGETATAEGVLAAVERDPRLETPKERCQVYRELAAFGRGIERADYPALAGGACADFPFEGWPWE